MKHISTTQFKKRRKGKINLKRSTNKLYFGTIGICILENYFFSEKQLLVLEKALLKILKPNKGSLWRCRSLNFFKSKKPIEVRMGKGKSALDYYCIKLKKNTVLFEIEGVNYIKFSKILYKIQYKFATPIYIFHNQNKHF